MDEEDELVAVVVESDNDSEARSFGVDLYKFLRFKQQYTCKTQANKQKKEKTF